MKKRELIKRLLCVGLALLFVLSLAACKGQADEQDSQQPTSTIAPTEAPTPTPTPPIPYTDVPSDAYYYDAVVWAYQNGITSDGTTFDPDAACTRAELIDFIWRAMGSPAPWIMENPFDDASPDDWYYKSALWAYQHNVITSTKVDSGNPCTSGQALTFLWRAEGQPDKLNTMAASSTYYGQPVAWVDKNGLLVGAEFDPDAPCTRADLMVYLYWAKEQWTPSEEEQRIQTEYGKIIYGSENTPDYADYVDVDGDGNAELLTLRRRYNNQWEIAVAVYADMDGHITKSCEAVFQEVEWAMNTPVDTFLTDGGVFSLYSADNQLYLCQNRSFYEPGTYPKDDDLYDFYKIEKEAVTFCEQRNIYTYYDRETGEEHNGDTGTSRSYTKQKDILRLDRQGAGYYKYSVLDKGILPGREESERYWTTYWEASDPIYAAVLSGDFSAFAGNYEDKSGWIGDIVLSKDGIVTGESDAFASQKPISITINEDGAIHCTVRLVEEKQYDGSIWRSSEHYYIYPVGISDNGDPNTGYQGDPSKIRIEYWWPSHGVDMAMYSKIS